MDYLIAPERLVTRDFVIRCYTPGDGPLISDAVNTSYEHLARWMPWASLDQSDQTSERFARTARARFLLAEDFTLGIFTTDERVLLGGTGFHLREGGLGTRCAEIGMFIRASAAGRGLGTQALKALLAWGFGDWPWLRLSWLCDARNHASLAVARNAGMRQEGVLRGQAAHVGDGRRDTVIHAALRDEWSAA